MPQYVSPSSAPVISRAAELLRAVGRAGAAGATTTALSRTAVTPRATAHRMLTALAREGLVDRDEASGRWFLGPEMYLLGSVASERYDVTPAAIDILRTLTRDTAESAFLSARRGDETVCVAGEEGSFPLRSHVLYPGRRFPLGVASAGLVILAHLPRAEIDDYLARTALEHDWGSAHARPAIEERIARTQIDGYCVNPGLLVEGSWGIGAAVFDALGKPRWALSLTGVQARMDGERQGKLGEILLRAAHVLSQRLAKR
jgi:DNA-binding IclR family transcriptional regulator